jgi:hypothetical protein
MCMRRRLINFFAAQTQRLFGWIMNSQPAHEILPNLWLGNRGASQDTQWLRSHGIVTIFNCTKDIPFAPGTPHMYRVPVDDNLQDEEIRNLELWAWEITYKLMKEYKAGHPILVHCHAGMQRSAAVMAMFLIAQYRCTTEEAIAYIKSRRPIAFYGNANFYRAIKNFERYLSKMIVDGDKYQQYPKIALPN